MSLDLRRLTAADAPALRALRIESFTLHPRDFRSSPADGAALGLAAWEAILARDIVLGLFDDGSLVGIGALSLETRAKLAHKGEIRGVYVRAAYRGAGGGERLMRALLDEARDKAEVVHLIVSDGNGPALRLYTRLGFTPWAFEPRAMKLDDGTYVDEIAMIRRMT